MSKNAGKKTASAARKKTPKADSPPRPAGETASESGGFGGFAVVGVGASAGGLEALKEFFSNLHAETNMAFVVVTHQHPGHTSLLPELLGGAAAIPVMAATEGVVLRPNQVFVAPPGGLLAIANSTLHRLEANSDEARRLPIDFFLRSLAHDQQERAICVILSGTGSDGTLGLKAIKGEGGMAMVQQAQTAKYTGMPMSAVGTGLADYVLSPAAMAGQLLAYAKGSYLRSGAASGMPAEPLQRVFLLLRNRTGHDFSGYKSNTISRRIERRMNVHGIAKSEDYPRFLREILLKLDTFFDVQVFGTDLDSDAIGVARAGHYPILKASSPTFPPRASNSFFPVTSAAGAFRRKSGRCAFSPPRT